jgi:multidrug efflux pump
MVVDLLKSIDGFRDVEDNRFIPGIQWEMKVDKAQAAKFGLDIGTIGGMIKFITNGVKIGTYRPQDSRDQLDVLLKFPQEYRTLEQINQLKMNTKNGLVPLSSMMTYSAQPKVGVINRVGGMRTLTVKADVKEGILVNNLLPQLKGKMMKLDFSPNVKIDFKGQEKDQKDNMVFLGNAFLIAIFIIAIILITQFNSFFSAFLILSAVIMSTVGVFIGLMISDMPFGIVMGGLGVISLAGIIVSNNIILIDTFDKMKHKIPDIREVLLRTCAQRLRPVILTKLTIILGLLPIMFAVDLNFQDREISIGAPSTQWWVQLSTCIVYGVLFASILTLFVTPSALLLWEGRKKRK